jgi:hypothetical protein
MSEQKTVDGDVAMRYLLDPNLYNPNQVHARDVRTIYKGGLIRNVPFRTGLENLLELEKKVYGKQTPTIQKVDAPVVTTVAALFNTIFGRRVWVQLNYEANAFAMIPKERWGPKTGWRVEMTEAGAARDGAVVENAQIPDTIRPTWREIQEPAKIIYHGWNQSQLAALMEGVDDNVAAAAELRRAIADHHRHSINQMLLCPCGTAGTNGVAGNPGGDSIESLMRVVSSNAEVTNCGDVAAGFSDLYGIDRDAAASWADAVVSHNANVARNLTLALVDNLLQQLWPNGARPKVILTGYDTLMDWSQLLEAERRYLETARIVPSFGGVRGPAPGVEAGFLVATYNGIPILESQDMPSTQTLSDILFLDTDYIRFATLQPTKYFETGLDVDMLYMNQLSREGGYETMGELRCYNFRRQGKIRDLQ